MSARRYAIVLTGNRDLAQDVVQEVLVRAQVKWRRIERTDAPEAYVRRMVLNEYLSWRRSWAARNVHAVGEKLADPMEMYLSDIYTITCDLAGIPGMSVPCGETSEGLPVGMQILARHFDEAAMFRLAHAFERAR